MTVLDRIALFSTLDLIALAMLFGFWIGIGWRIEHSGARHPSTYMLMGGYRRAWMKELVSREPRVFDAQILTTLRQGTAFFASTSMIALGGTLAMIGNADRLAVIAQDITLSEHPSVVWEVKLLVICLFLTNAFLKFAWSNRLFGYCAVLMAAVPNNKNDPNALVRAGQAAEINITGARSFNRGLRSLYFALAAAAWLAGPLPLGAAALVTLIVIWRREFASDSRKILLQGSE